MEEKTHDSKKKRECLNLTIAVNHKLRGCSTLHTLSKNDAVKQRQSNESGTGEAARAGTRLLRTVRHVTQRE